MTNTASLARRLARLEAATTAEPPEHLLRRMRARAGLDAHRRLAQAHRRIAEAGGSPGPLPEISAEAQRLAEEDTPEAAARDHRRALALQRAGHGLLQGLVILDGGRIADPPERRIAEARGLVLTGA